MSSGEKGSSRKKSLSRLDFFGELNGLAGRDPLVDVVQQFDLVAQLLADLMQHGNGAADVSAGLVHRVGVQRLYLGSVRAPAPARAVGRHAGHAHLEPDVAVALRHGLLRAVHDLRHFAPADAGVAGGRFAALPAQQLIDGHPRLASLDVPERLVDAADGVVQHRAVAPVGAVVAGLPGVVDPVGRLADQERLQVFLDGGNHQVGPLRERGAPVAVQSGLIGGDLDHDQPDSARLCGNHADVLDLRRRGPARRPRHLLLRLHFSCGDQPGQGASHRCAKNISAFHFTLLNRGYNFWPPVCLFGPGCRSRLQVPSAVNSD